jgi:hypothetical protein
MSNIIYTIALSGELADAESKQIQISASTWTPLSSQYSYDSDIEIGTNFIKWHDGYTAFEQDIFKQSVDYSINRDTILYLPSAKDLFTFIQDKGLDETSLGAYVIISVSGNPYFDYSRQYITVVDTDLYLNSELTDDCLFRFILNSDGTFSLLGGNGYYVTASEKTPFDLTLENVLPDNESYRQKFNWHEENDKIFFSIKITNKAIIGPQTEERFWSFSKVGPEKGKIRANGLIPFKDYDISNKIYENNYLFDITGFALYFKPTGLITNHTFVKYYNELNDKTNNKNTEISNSISNIHVNHLVDLPYNTQIDINNKNISINFANLKNVMTREYEYNIRNNICNCDPHAIGCGIIYNINRTTPCDFVIS